MIKTINPEQYQLINFSGKNYRLIPATDWYPPDFVDVRYKTLSGHSILCYYSPATNQVIQSSTEKVIPLTELVAWLREDHCAR